MVNNIDLLNVDCTEYMKTLPCGSIDCIFTDPPYLYLKNQKLDIQFDEDEFFSQCKRVLKKGGLIALFGRGTSFYRWNTILKDSGFIFKEEIVWDKNASTSPLNPIGRKHETVSIHSNGNGGHINKCVIPFLEEKNYDIKKIYDIISRLQVVLNNEEKLTEIKNFLETRTLEFTNRDAFGSGLTIRTHLYQPSHAVSDIKSVVDGCMETDVISCYPEHYGRIHPTQKPVRMLERVLNAISNPDDIVLDPFAGSASIGVACCNTGRRYIGCEIDSEYYELAQARLDSLVSDKEKDSEPIID